MLTERARTGRGPEESGYGYGVFVGEHDGRRWWHHSGHNAGFKAFTVNIPDLGRRVWSSATPKRRCRHRDAAAHGRQATRVTGRRDPAESAEGSGRDSTHLWMPDADTRRDTPSVGLVSIAP